MRSITRKRSRTWRLAAAVAATALALAACNGDDVVDDDVVDDDVVDDDVEDDEAAADDQAFLTLATGSTGGTYFPLGGAMAGVWNDNIDAARVNTQSSGASVENLRLLDGGEVDMILAVNGVADTAAAGTGEFDGTPLDFVTIANIYGEVTQIVATADSGITEIADLAGARVALGPPGSGTEVIARTILETEGIDPDNDITPFNDTFGEAADGLRDGRLDAAFAILALPAGSIEEVATSVDITLVSIPDDLMSTLLADDPTLSELTIEAGTYSGQDEDAVTVTNWATLYTTADLSDDIVYELTRVLFEETESIANAVAVGNQIQLDTALDGNTIDVHPGAQRFYDEQ
ncbi:MAG: TAXI family TRAP transporter solute-binding subunit [Nitriliruptor sp.]|nr:MAG: TAXI family TRAP transporter solute-binding subunit [Nitriliruptor sp.]